MVVEEEEGKNTPSQDDAFVGWAEEDVVGWDCGRGFGIGIGLGFGWGGCEGWRAEDGRVGAADGVVEGGGVEEGGVEEVGGLAGGFQGVGSEG